MSRETILVIDDSPAVRSLAEQYLSDMELIDAVTTFYNSWMCPHPPGGGTSENSKA